ncbi:protein MAIN-LIKE 2-like [Arachis hypogaea]|uniref:protein MAIN-LIKE 2-like n=1 Tax=Arachis hypogaea TaxID=3818 RepID=UPI003B21E206
MPFGECAITLQDVAYQLRLPINGHYISGCLTDFETYIEGGCPAWASFKELLDTFRELPDGADEATVRRYAWAYIMMMLGTQLFVNKSSTRIYIRWLPYVGRLEDMDGYNWGSVSLSWLYRCMFRVGNRHVVKLAGQLQLLQSWIFWQFPELDPLDMIRSVGL